MASAGSFVLDHAVKTAYWGGQNKKEISWLSDCQSLQSTQVTEVYKKEKKKKPKQNCYSDSLGFLFLATEPILSNLHKSCIILFQEQLYMIEIICSLEIC